MNAQDSKAYAAYYEVSEHYPSFDDYCEFVDEALLDEFLELYCFTDLEDELGENFSRLSMVNWWSNHIDTYKQLRMKEAYNEGWRVDLFIEVEEQRIEQDRY